MKQLDKVLDEFTQSLKWMEGYTGVRPPFKEYNMAILPNYPFGGMENPGAFQLSERRIFLNKDASQDDELKRMELVAHETAHLWFGDIVHVNWQENLWMKEVFANFMSSKITRRQFERNEHEMNFINTYQTRAIAIDRTEGTHPIEQKAELNHSNMLYDNIIYNKATVMMRMLEQTLGATNMQNGLRRFIQEKYFKDANWDELIDILDKENPAAGVRQFSEVWVKQKGMPIINTVYKDGQIIVSQTDPFGRGLCWRQKFVIQTVNDLKPSRTLVVDNPSEYSSGYSVGKFRNTYAGTGSPRNSQFIDTDYFLMRSAEAYLIAAEADARLNGGNTSSTGTNYINALRQRANASTRTSYTTEQILDERARELYYEGFRRTDLIRYGYFGGNKSGEYLWEWKGGAQNGAAIPEWRNLFAIPADDLNANPNLKQNPGYGE